MAKKRNPVGRTPLPRRKLAETTDVRTRGAAVRASRRERTAIHVWYSLPRQQQLELVQELIEARRSELLALSNDIVMLGYGYRTKRVPDQGTGSAAGTPDGKIVALSHIYRRQKTDEPCVTFMVRRKWDARSDPGRKLKGELPRHLFTYCTLNGVRLLCAVPVDVEDGRHYDNIQLHGNPRVRATTASSPVYVNGVTCCGVRGPGGLGPMYALGCHHVFAMSEAVTFVPMGISVTLQSDNSLVGLLSQYYGIVDDDGFFLDAALVESTENNAAFAITEPSIEFWAQRVIELADACSIHTPEGNLDADLVKVWPEFDRIPYPTLGYVKQRYIVELHVLQGVTQKGDSGSPIFNRDGGGIFQGMHIAGDPNTARSYMIPAFELLRAEHYGFGMDDRFLQLVTPPSFAASSGRTQAAS